MPDIHRISTLPKPDTPIQAPSAPKQKESNKPKVVNIGPAQEHSLTPFFSRKHHTHGDTTSSSPVQTGDIMIRDVPIIGSIDGCDEWLVCNAPGLTRPPNFSMVKPAIYRSGFPTPEHFPFLQTLGLKSILSLVAEEYPAANVAFMEENHIQHFQVPIPGNKDAADISTSDIMTAMAVVLDSRNHPLLIHCNKGKHRTGCVVACMRKVHEWKLHAALQEYRQHSQPKERLADEQLIASFDPAPAVKAARALFPASATLL
ncbi:MAG: hypothetical protein M1838_001773 [Thelocarpon superellum]|nr:MAG: hypothetical protein M1838_001773 [Thelocarpon superellum]